MWRRAWIVWSAALAVAVVGCGGSNPPSQQPAPDGGEQQTGQDAGGTAAAQKQGPGPAVAEFLEAVRTGDDEKAAMMLTEMARRKTAEMNMQVAPPGSDTARFEVGKVEYVAENGARVTTTWSDLDQNAQRRSDQIVWMVRKDPEGWRIAGVAATVFEGEPPLLLNFEDPEEMIRKQEWVQQEARRRAQQGGLQAQGAQPPDEAIRR